MLKQGTFLGYLLTWLLLPRLIQPSSPSTCDSCGDNCWKCIGSAQVPNNLGIDLEILYLSDNTLDPITGKSFSAYGNIRELYLNNCSLKCIPNGTFSYLKALELVDLSHNKFSEGLPETTFRENRNLKEVILSYNNFSRIQTPFLSSGSIHTLHMIGNNIAEVSSESFKLLPQLRELHLEKNRLTVLPPDLFTPLKYFSELFIDHSTLLANVPFQSCTPGLIVHAGGKILDCGTNKLEIATFTTGAISRFVTNHAVTPSTTQSPENETQSSKITNNIKYTRRATSGFSSTSSPQLFTSREEHLTKSTESTPIATEEPTRTFPHIIGDIKITILLLITACILLLTLILYLAVKHCWCPPSRSHTERQYEGLPYYATAFPDTFYDPLLRSTKNCSIPIVKLYRPSYDPVLVHASRQTLRPVSMASHYSDHSYQEIVQNRPNMVGH